MVKSWYIEYINNVLLGLKEETIRCHYHFARSKMKFMPLLART